jgi:4-hydroxy-2-oxoheptanedioate aldolase
MQHKLLETWDKGNGAINAWLAIPNAITAEIAAMQDFDSVTIDLQHGLNDYQIALSMLQAVSTSDKTAMVRVPWNEPGIIMKLLDAGALGVVCPMINTRADAEAFVGACRYTPEGYRSAGPTRAMLIHGADYIAKANDAVVTLAMIETREALENVTDIVATPGLTGIYVGPSDLSLSLGYGPGMDHTKPEMVAAIMQIRDACKAAGIKIGIHCGSTEYARKMIAEGFDLTTISSDLRAYAAAMGQITTEMRA